MKFDIDKAYICKHENVYENYYYHIECGTPLCNGATEEHCKDCEGYVTHYCPCGFEGGGVSGWSYKRYKTFMKKKYGWNL